MGASLRVVLVVAIIIVAFSGVANATVWTVSSIAALRSAVTAAAPGDIIELTDGIYTWSDAPSACVITNKNNLTIRSQSGNRDAVVISGAGISNTSTEFCFKLYNSDYITFENLTMQSVYWHCVQVNEGSDYVTFRNLKMWDAGEGPIKATSPGTAGPWCDYGLVENCLIGYTDYGYRSSVEGIDLIAAVGWVITDCDFYRARKKKGPSQVGWGFFAKGNSQDTVVENCYLEDCDIALSFGGGGTDPIYARDGDLTYEHRRGIMRNNVVNRTKDVAVSMNWAAEYKLYNNTLWSTFVLADSSIDVRYNAYGQIYNNLCSEGYRLRDPESQATLSNNIFFVSPTLFVDQPGGNFHLLSTATSAIDQGLDTTADVPYDMDWQTRPRGAAVDIGADEF